MRKPVLEFLKLIRVRIMRSLVAAPAGSIASIVIMRPVRSLHRAEKLVCSPYHLFGFASIGGGGFRSGGSTCLGGALNEESSTSIGTSLSHSAGRESGAAFTVFGFGERSGAALLGSVAGGFARCPQMHPIFEIQMLQNVDIL